MEGKLHILFFLVHPSKFHLFRNTFRRLEQHGHSYEIVIAGKDVLAPLLSGAGLPFTDLFPGGRKKNPKLPFFLSGAYLLFQTLWRLNRYTKRKKFDVFVTDDALTVLGRLKGIPSVMFTDNDLATVKKISLLYRLADIIVAPQATDLGSLSSKKISFRGHKALAHLHPSYFTKDSAVPLKYGLGSKPLVFVRLSRLNANHDTHGNPGITDEALFDLLSMVPASFEVLLSAERTIPGTLDSLRKDIQAADLPQVLAQAALFIGDSATMASEASVCGVPSILVNNIAAHCGVNVELKNFGLQCFFNSWTEARPLVRHFFEGTATLTSPAGLKEYIRQSTDFHETMVKAIEEVSQKKATTK